MKINVTENKVSIKEEQILNENEYNIHKIQFDFSSEYTDDLVKIALFSIDNHTYKKIISNNECDIPPEVLTQRGYSILGVYAYKTEQDTLVLRYSPSPTRISVYDGSYKADAENSEPITPSEIEQYQQILQNSLQQFQNQYNALVEETEGDIQTIEDELQRKVDEGYFDGEDGFSPIAKVIQKSNGATIEIEDKNGKTTADVLNGEDGYTPVRGVDYWTEEDKQEVEEEATQQIEGKIEEYNENAAEKLNQYNQNSVQKTNDYNTNASQKVESFNTNASSKLSEYNSNAETKKSAYDENATQKTNSFNTNATNKLTEYNTNHTEKMNTYNNNSTQKLNAFNENATQKTEDFDEHTEEIQDNIEILQRTDNQILSRFNKDEEVSGQDITLTGTTEIKFAKPPLPMGNSEQEEIFYIETTIKKGFIDSEGNVRADSNLAVMTDYIPVFPNTLYNINRSISTSYTNIRFFDNNKNFLGTDSTEGIMTSDKNNNRMLANETSLSMTILNNNVAFMVFNDYSNDLNTTYTISTLSPTPDYPQPITNVTGDVEVKVQNKNLFDKNNFEYVNGKRLNDNGEVVSDADSSYSITLFEVKPNTAYTIQGTQSETGKSTRINYYDINKNFLNRSTNYQVDTYTFTTPQNCYYIGLQLRNSTYINLDIIQLEQGSTATPYTPHKEQAFTFPLGNEKLMLGDYLADDGIHHVRKEIRLSSEIDFAMDSTGNGFNRFVAKCDDMKSGANNPMLSNYFTQVLNSDTEPTTRNKECMASSSGSNYKIMLVLNATNFPNKTALYEWLSNDNVKLQYMLEEEIIVPYTSAQQEAYNQIKNAYSYDEMTIITGSSDENKPFFTVQTYKDLNKELNNKVDKVQGKELSSNDFTDTLKEKLEGLENYDDTEIKADISDIQDEQTEQNTDIEKLQTENARLKATLPTTIGEGQAITLDKTAELEFKKPPLPMGNSEQFSTTGKNKFDGTYEKIYTFGSSPYKCASGNDIRSAVVKVNPNTTYTISKEVSNRFRISQYAERPVVETTFATSYTQAGDSNTVYTLTTENTTQYLLIQVTNENQENVKMQVEEGSSATSYEPYTGGQASPNPDYPQEITNVTGDVEVLVENKNLFDNNTRLNNQSLTWADGTTYVRQGNIISDYIIINNIASIFSNYIFYIFFYDKDKNYLGNSATVRKTTGTSYSNLQLPVDERIKYFRLLYASSSNNSLDMSTINNIIVTKSSDTTSTYVPHKEQVLPLTLGNIELCKIGDYQDYFYKESNKWYLHKEINKYVFTGTETWYKANDNINVYVTNLSQLDRLSGNNSNFICNYFKYLGDAQTQILGNCMSFNLSEAYRNSCYIQCDTSIAQSNIELKNYVKGLYDNQTPLLVYSVLKTPTDTEITDTTLISQLEAINNAISYEEQTNISSNQNALFSVEAYLDSKEVIDEKYTKPSTGIPKTDLASDVQTSLNKADSALQEHQDISGKQDITDNTLTTINKTVPTAINEVNSIAKLANQAKSYSTYQAFINYLNTAEKTEFIPGQSFMIQTKLVPDLWVYSVENTSVQYTYTTDEDFITYTNQATGGQVGYYKLAQLETQKVDLTNYVTFDNYATSTTAGVVKTNSMYGVSTSSYTQNITATTKTYDQYQSSNNATFVGKGTLENVITGKNLESANNKTTTISSSSTDNEYPSAKAVYDYIQSILNNGSN